MRERVGWDERGTGRGAADSAEDLTSGSREVVVTGEMMLHQASFGLPLWRFRAALARHAPTQQPAHLLARRSSLLLEAPVLQLESVGHRRLDDLLTVHVCALLEAVHVARERAVASTRI